MSTLRRRLSQVDERVGNPLRRGRTSVRRGMDLARLGIVARERRRAHPGCYQPERADEAALAELRTDGTTILRGLVDPDLLAQVSAAFERALESGEGIEPPPYDAARGPQQRHKIEDRVPAEVLTQGQDAYRDLTNRVDLEDPLVALPELLGVVMLEPVIHLAAAHLRSVPAVGSVTLRKSYANDLPVSDTLHWHTDTNSARLLKVFVYLHDVGPEGGPFTYVRGSHRDRFTGWQTRRRWDHEDIVRHYDPDRIRLHTAQAGDVIVADTSGFHRGAKPVAADRSMLTTAWVLEPEFGGRYPRNAARASDVERLDPLQRATADLLDLR